jgi:hypothetical protein
MDRAKRPEYQGAVSQAKQLDPCLRHAPDLSLLVLVFTCNNVVLTSFSSSFPFKFL